MTHRSILQFSASSHAGQHCCLTVRPFKASKFQSLHIPPVCPQGVATICPENGLSDIFCFVWLSRKHASVQPFPPRVLRLLSSGDACLRWSWRRLSRADGWGWPSPDLILVSGAQFLVKPVQETSKQKWRKLEMTEAENNAAAAETVWLPEGYQTSWWTGASRSRTCCSVKPLLHPRAALWFFHRLIRGTKGVIS